MAVRSTHGQNKAVRSTQGGVTLTNIRNIRYFLNTELHSK